MFNRVYISINKIKMILNKSQKRLFWLVLIAALIAAILETLSISVILPLVNALLTPEKMFNNEMFQPVIAFFQIDTNEEMIVMVVVGTICVYILKNLYLIWFSWAKAKYASKVQRECSVYMAESYMNRGYTYFLDKSPNHIFQGIVGDVGGVYTIINSIIYIFTKGMIVAMIGIFMFVSDWIMASGLLVASLICLLLLIFGFKKPVKQVGIKVRDYTIEANQVLFQFLYGSKEVIAMRKQKQFIEQYKDKMYLRQKEDIKRTVYTDAPNSIVEAFCITAIMIVLCIRMITSDDLTGFVAVLASFAVAAFRILPAIGYLSSSFNNIVSNMPSLNAVYENMIEARAYNDSFNDINAKDNEEYANHVFIDSISVKDVTFNYSKELGNVLEELSLEIKKDTAVAFIGESGAGKSTLADIILGILPANKGEVLLDGINIREVPNLWSSLIGFVPQSIYLCDASIAENVAFGVEKSKIDIDRVKEVLKMANVMEFIDTLPEGLETVVGDRGIRLSGGQRQRIGIARALYHNPQILILDEATSALDNDTEQSVMDAIESLQGNMTMIIIAHRLTTIKNCDKIYEIKNGRAIERKYSEIV